MFLSWLFGGKNKPIGEVVHFFDKINVAVVVLSSSLKLGDKIKVVRGEDTFEETVASMQVNHEDVASGRKGDEVAIKLSRATKRGAQLFRA